MMMLTKTKEYSMLMMVRLFLVKKLVVMMFVFQLTKVILYVLMMNKTEDKPDQGGLLNPTQSTAQKSMI
jgi:hypothetical protein